jgi:hypothetical protein
VEQLPDYGTSVQPIPRGLELFSSAGRGHQERGGGSVSAAPDSTPSSPSPSLVEALQSRGAAPGNPMGYAAIHGRRGILTQLSEASDALNDVAPPQR